MDGAIVARARRRGRRRGAVWCLVIAMAAVPCASAAQTTAAIFGTVSDEAGLPVPGVTITATNTLTNETRTTVTNATGTYSLPELALGIYTVRSELTGFKSAVREGIQLSLNRTARVDLAVSIGTISEQLIVTGDAPLVDTAKSEMGGIVDRRRIENLPLGERNTLSLVSLMPGTNQLRENNTQGFTTNKVTANGTRQEDNNFLLDGGDNTSMLRNYGNSVPNPDAVQEFRVISNNYSAEFGKTAGVVVNVVTKSGTNQFTGTSFEFHRDDRLNEKGFFEKSKLVQRRNQFGATFGGPVMRDKTFFFSTYQGLREQGQSSDKGALVPTDAERRGDFSASVDGSGKLIVVRDPLTGQPFPGNVIPSSRLSPTVQQFMKRAVPQPNNSVLGPNSLRSLTDAPNDNDQFLIKIDHVLSPSHKLQGAYFWQASSIVQNLGDIGYAARHTESTQYNLNIHEYWTIRSNLLNHVRATFSRSVGDRRITPDDLTLTALGSKFSPLPAGPTMPPQVQALGYFDAGVSFGGPKDGNNYVIADTLDWLTGKHQLKVGVEGWSRRLYDTSTQSNQGGQFTFDGKVTGYPLADLMLGLSSEFRIQDQSYKTQSGYALYTFAQDDYHVTPRLTLNLGVRYELNLLPVHPLNLVKAYRPGVQSKCVPQAPIGMLFYCDGIPRGGATNDTNDVAPRLGFAYDLRGDGRTSLRGGYGLTYTFPVFNSLQDVMAGPPLGGRNIRVTPGTSPTGTIPIDDPYVSLPGGNPFPTIIDPTRLTFSGPADYAFVDYNLKNAYFHQYNLSVQRQFATDWGIDVAYVGNQGRNLPGQIDMNAPVRTATATTANINARRPNPAYQRLNVLGPSLASHYNGLQTKLEKRFSHGHAVLASYTWSKAIDQQSFYSTNGRFFDNYHPEWDTGRSREDRRHTLVVSSIVQLPAGHGIVGALAGGWNINTIGTFYSGRPISGTGDEASPGIISGRDNDFDGNASNDRPVVVGEWRLPRPTPEQALGGQPWLNPAAFRQNLPGENNVLARNAISGPALKVIDLGLAKRIPTGGRRELQLRIDAFNLFNWVNFRDPVGTLSSPNFGKVLDSEPGRTIQLGARYSF